MVKESIMHLHPKWQLNIAAALLAFVVTLTAEKPTIAGTESYPRLANYYLSGGKINDEEARMLARWDLVITGFEVPYESPKAFALLKQLNPSMTLLPYLDAISRDANYVVNDTQNPRYLYRQRSSETWLLKSAEGRPMGFWPGVYIVNPTDFAPRVSDVRWNDFVGHFGTEMTTFQTGWDGIYFDDAMATISWLNHGKIDINNDGRNDTAGYIDAQWQEGMRKLFRRAREQLGPSSIFVANSSNVYEEFTNGRLYEAAFRGTDDWHEEIDRVNAVLANVGYQPRIVIVNATTNNDGNWKDWRRFRFALTSTLMTDAYFSFDFGDKWHQQLCWYDEYDADLGMPQGGAYERMQGAWQRDFDRGIVLVNPTSQTAQVNLDGRFQRLDGTQDKNINNGKKTTEVILLPFDGIVLKRPSTSVLHTIRWSKGALTLTRNGVAQWTMYPYDNRWRGNVSMATGDVNGDGIAEIVLAAGPGGGPHVRIVGMDGTLKGPGFFAYDKKRRTGASVRLADVNGDGAQKILASSGRGERPEVRVFDYRGTHVETLNPDNFHQSFVSVERTTLDHP